MGVEPVNETEFGAKVATGVYLLEHYFQEKVPLVHHTMHDVVQYAIYMLVLAFIIFPLFQLLP